MSKEERGPSRIMWRPSGRIESPGPSEAWRALLAASPDEIEAARAVFVDALERAA